MPVSWFKSDTGHFLFNTNIDLMKNHFTGITIVKPDKSGNYRVIMITETGLKLLDIEFFPDSAPEVHYIMEAMDKKALKRTLKNDLSLILMNQTDGRSPGWLLDHKSDTQIAKYRISNGKQFYLFKTGDTYPYKANYTKGLTNKVTARYYGSDKTGPDSIGLVHNNIPLKLSLFRIHD